jgi:hypothetical protein
MPVMWGVLSALFFGGVAVIVGTVLARLWILA